MKAGTIGDCSNSKCHGKPNQMPDAPRSYKWLEGQGYMGTAPALADDGSSCLSWFGGDMPPTPKKSPEAVTEMKQWATTGALNN
jgi:hypothetical protein